VNFVSENVVLAMAPMRAVPPTTIDNGSAMVMSGRGGCVAAGDRDGEV
jgi:hypothetical protein